MPTSVRFDVTSDTFATVSAAYDAAVERADTLLRRLHRAEKDARFSASKKLKRKPLRLSPSLRNRPAHR